MAKAYRDGTLRRNFQGYTTDKATTLIALGASSIGRMPKGFVQNTPDMKTYSTRITQGQLATARGVGVSKEDQRRWQVIEHLMCRNRIKHAILEKFQTEASVLTGFVHDGLLLRDGEDLIITESGKPFVRQIAAIFDQYFPNNTAKHSKAV